MGAVGRSSSEESPVEKTDSFLSLVVAGLEEEEEAFEEEEEDDLLLLLPNALLGLFPVVVVVGFFPNAAPSESLIGADMTE